MALSKIPVVPGTKTLARGSVVIGNASGEPSALAIGSNTYVLKSDGTDISWGADQAGTITAFTNGVDNRVVTATSATALNGESALTFSSPTLKNTTASSGATASGESDELVLEGTAEVGMSILSATSGSGSVFFGDSGANGQGRLVYYHGDDSMRFVINASEAMRINSSGDLSIGTDTSAAKLNVYTTGGYSFFRNTATSGVGSDLIATRCDDTSTGNYNQMVFQQGATNKFVVQDDGDVYNSNGTYGQLSDERLKKDITDANSQWDDIKAIKVKNYTFKHDDAHTHIGVIAQEIEASGMNGLVKDTIPTEQYAEINSDFGTVEDGTADNGAEPIKDEDGNITGYEKLFTRGQKVKAVKYSVLYMKAIKALQESMERIEQLEAKVTALENA